MFPPYRSSIKQKVALAIMLARIKVLLVAAIAFMIYDQAAITLETLSLEIISLPDFIVIVTITAPIEADADIGSGREHLFKAQFAV
jgi:hypothetical protein